MLKLIGVVFANLIFYFFDELYIFLFEDLVAFKEIFEESASYNLYSEY
jgi:hypothetical protein